MAYPKRHFTQTVPHSESRVLNQTKKREQIKITLINKFRVKYSGSKDASLFNQIDQIITREVESLMQQSQITQNSLTELDRKLQGILGQGRETPKPAATPQLNSSHSNRNLQKAGEAALGFNTLTAASRGSMRSSTSVVSIGSLKQGGQSQDGQVAEQAWNEIVKYNSIKFQDEQDKALKQKELQKQQLKEELAKQVAEKKMEKLQEQKEHEAYIEMQRELLSLDQRKEQSKQMNYQSKVMAQAQLRSDQIRANEIRRTEEVKTEKIMGIEMRKKMEKEMKEDEERQRLKIEQFKKQQSDQLDVNKKLREEAKQKEWELDNQPATGSDLMAQIYNVKKHISYEKRERNDKILEIMKDQLEGGDTMRKRQMEERAMQNYIKNKEQQDLLGEQRKKKMLKDAELEAKRVLDMQIFAQNSKKQVRKFEENVDAKYMHLDLNDFNKQEQQKREEMDKKLKEHGSMIMQQIHLKKQPKKLDPRELQINKLLLQQLNEDKARTNISSPKPSKYASL